MLQADAGVINSDIDHTVWENGLMKNCFVVKELYQVKGFTIESNAIEVSV